MGCCYRCCQERRGFDARLAATTLEANVVVIDAGRDVSFLFLVFVVRKQPVSSSSPRRRERQRGLRFWEREEEEEAR